MSEIHKARISIVIPVYNEAERLRDCLEAISRQRQPAYEVIVVDNNSTDDTAEVARDYGFVRLIAEKKQGVTHARTTGFNAAKGDIIGRIDADTLLPADWTATIQHLFQDKELAAVSGSADYYDFVWGPLANTVDRHCRAYLAATMQDQLYLWGANMALRRNIWQRIAPELCAHPGLHEDFDLGIHIQQAGYKVRYAEQLVAGVSSRRIDTSFSAYVKYCLVSPKTYKHHGMGVRFYMYPVLMLCWLTYMPGRLLYRAYDHESGSFSVQKLLTVTDARVDPTSNGV